MNLFSGGNINIMKDRDTGTIILALFSGYIALFSGLFMLFTTWHPQKSVAFTLGFIVILIGILAITALGGWSLVVILLGFYFMGRASGYIDNEWLRYGLGIPLVILGSTLLVRVLADIFSKPKGQSSSY